MTTFPNRYLNRLAIRALAGALALNKETAPKRCRVRAPDKACDHSAIN